MKRIMQQAKKKVPAASGRRLSQKEQAMLKNVRRLQKAGAVRREKTQMPSRGGRRVPVADEPRLLLRMYAELKSNPAAPLSKAAAKLGVSHPTAQKLEDNINAANAFARRKGLPLKQVLRDFRELRKEIVLM